MGSTDYIINFIYDILLWKFWISQNFCLLKNRDLGTKEMQSAQMLTVGLSILILGECLNVENYVSHVDGVGRKWLAL